MNDPQTNDPPHPLSPFAVRLTATALALGLAVDVLFRRQALGISFPIWSMLSATALLLAARWHGIRSDWTGYGLAGGILLLSIGVAARLEPLTVGMSVLGAVLLFALWIRTLTHGRLHRFGWLDLALAAIVVPLETLLRPWPTLSDALTRLAGDRAVRSRGMALVRGLLLAVPIVLVFLGLLTSADLVFRDFVEDAFAWLDLEWIRELIGHTIIIGAAGLISLGALVAAVRRDEPHQLVGEQQPLIPRFIGITESEVVLAAVDLLFVVFVIIQFRYLFGGEANITAAGYTYADYARRGFGEMVWAAIFGQGLILGFGHWIRQNHGRQPALANALSAGLVAMLLVTLLSALTRLLLYEEAYGFTRSRTYAHVFIFWLAALLVSLVVLLYRGRLRLYAPITALAAAGFVLSLVVLNVDGFIAERNLDRYFETGDLDVSYLAQLTNDAAPTLAERASADIPQELLAQLACRKALLNDQLEQRSWQSYHFGRERAERALGEIAELLQPYRVSSESTRWQVEGPGLEEETYCSWHPLD